jgi:hypothetical protein
MTARPLLFAASAALFPWAHVAMLAFGAGTVWLAFALLRDYGSAALDDPARCPSCGRDDLLRVEASIERTIIPLLHCRSCGDAYRLAGGTLYRDTGRPLL